MRPLVGGPSENGPRCAYSDAPGMPSCNRPGKTHHLIGADPNLRGYVGGLVACEEHFKIANALAVDWHPMGGHCGVFGTHWHRRTATEASFCAIDEDETDAEFAALDVEVPA